MCHQLFVWKCNWHRQGHVCAAVTIAERNSAAILKWKWCICDVCLFGVGVYSNSSQWFGNYSVTLFKSLKCGNRASDKLTFAPRRTWKSWRPISTWRTYGERTGADRRAVGMPTEWAPLNIYCCEKKKSFINGIDAKSNANRDSLWPVR